MKTINKVFLILLVNLAASPLFAQDNLPIGSTKIITFVKKIDGAGDLTAAVQAGDGAYVTVSRINDASTSLLVMKIKASGQKEWQRRLDFDFYDSYLVRINGIAQTRDGGFILVGQVGCPYYWECGSIVMSRATLIKLRADGTVAWKKGFVEPIGGFSSAWGDFFSSVVPVSDGGVIAIGGRFASPYLIVRVTATGEIVWKKHFGKISGCESATCTGKFPSLIYSTSTPDHGFIAVLPGPNDVVFLKITDLGNVVWKKQLKDLGFASLSACITADGGVILAGNDSNSKLKVAVLKADGRLDWKAGYFLKSPVQTSGSVLNAIQTHDGGYAVTGTTGGLGEAFIVKIDSSRKLVYQNTFVGQAVGAVFATADGGSLLFGSSATGDNPPDLLVLKVNSEGIVAGCHFFRSLGGTVRSSFGRLRIGHTNTTESDVESLNSVGFGLTSGVSNNPISSVCR